jgi:hypothetical protein
MSTKTMIALATALTLGAASVAMASDRGEDDSGGFRQLGSGGVVTDGVNPVYHRSIRNNAGNAYGYVPTVPHKTTTTK